MISAEISPATDHLQQPLIMVMRTVVPELAHITHVAMFPSESEEVPAMDECALVTQDSTSKADLDTMVRKGMVKGLELSGDTS
jgi:hypothetical protein